MHHALLALHVCREAEKESSKCGGGLPAGVWDSLAAAAREGLARRPSSHGSSRAAGKGEGDEEEQEGDAALVLTLADIPGGTLSSRLYRFLLSGQQGEAAQLICTELQGQASSSSIAGNSSDGGSGSGGSGSDSSGGGSSGGSGSSSAKGGTAEALRSAVLKLRSRGVRQKAAGAPGGDPPGGAHCCTIFIWDRASSTDGPGGLGTTLGAGIWLCSQPAGARRVCGLHPVLQSNLVSSLAIPF